MEATFVQTNFLGGEVSKFAQGRTDRPDYRTMMNVCLNGIPVEAGAWVRRPGTHYAGHTRNGAPAMEIPFEFKQSSPYNMEFTDGFVRFRTGPTIVPTNGAATVSAISTASPAVVTTSAAHGWTTGNQVMFSGLSALCPLLQNRQFVITVTASDKFSIADALTAANIDGSTLGWATPSPLPTVTRILELASPYISGQWSDLKWVQAERQSVLLRGGTKPYVITLTTDPTATTFANFSLAAAVFKDGPYLDPITGGALATPSAKIGLINITIAFNAYDATVAYSVGDFVTYSSVNYQSLTDANVGHQPDISSSNWLAVSASQAVANPDGSTGFDGRDIGRSIRLFSQPNLWAVGTGYVAGNVISYNNVDYVAAASSTGVIPGTDPTKWSISSNASKWTWGRITSLLSQISQTLSGAANIGDFTGNGGLAASFDGIIPQGSAACSDRLVSFAFFGDGTQHAASIAGYIGRNYSGASAQAISQAAIYPSTNLGFYNIGANGNFVTTSTVTVTMNLRAKASLPASGSDGTLLGTSSFTSLAPPSAVTIASSDQVTTWNYVWIEVILTCTFQSGDGISNGFDINLYSAEVQLFNPPGTGTSSGIQVQVVGDALLYTNAVRVWRLGTFSNKTGWPTCGTWHEGRLWLAGALDNRFDGSVPNDPFNFAPTGASGAVADSNAISYTLNSAAVNPIYWMQPDLQGIVLGTLNGGYLVQASNNNNVLTPTSIQAHQIKTMNGVASMIPADAGSTLLLVHRFRRKLQEYFSDVFSGRFQAQNVSWKSKHLLQSPIAQVVMQEELAPVMWARLDDGSLVGMTYKRENLMSSQEPNFSAWHRHTLGSARTVTSLCVGPSIDGTLDTLSMVTAPWANGSAYHVELLTDIPQEGDTLSEAWFLDDAAIPTSTVSTATPSAGAPYGGLTLNGLWHLNGKSVTAWLGGLDCGDYPVTSGAIFVPYGDGVSGGTGGGMFTAQFVTNGVTADGVTMFTGTMPAVVGFTYTSEGQIVRPHSPAESGARNGPAFGKLRRAEWVMALFEGTQQVSVGTTFGKLYPVQFKSPGGINYKPHVQFSGMHRQTLRDDYGFDGMLCWRSTRPYPANVITIGAALSTQDV